MSSANELLKSLWADLTDRRLLPFVGLAVVALVAALGYAALAGGSSSPTAAAPPPAKAPSATGVAVTPAQSGTASAVAETTDGTGLQRHGHARDPFAPLAGAVTSATATAARATSSVTASTTTSSSAGSSSSTTSSSSSGSSGSATSGSSPASKPSTPSKPKAPAKPKTVYEVTLALGPIAPGSTLPSSELSQLQPISKPTALPSAKQKLLEFMGVTVTGKGATATFALVGEVIISGSGACVPSATDCKLVNLKEGTSEHVEYIQPDGQPAALELRVQKIVTKQASSASFGVLVRAEHAVASRRSDGSLLAAAGLHYSRRIGVLAY
jgi:hypothetical protein